MFREERGEEFNFGLCFLIGDGELVGVGKEMGA